MPADLPSLERLTEDLVAAMRVAERTAPKRWRRPLPIAAVLLAVLVPSALAVGLVVRAHRPAPPTRRIALAGPPAGGERAVRQAAATLSRRLRAAAGATAHVTVRGARGSITVAAPRRVVTPLLTRGAVAVYDWEASVIGPDGKTAPQDASVTGGAAAGAAGTGASQGYYAAVRQASALGPVSSTAGTTGARFYGVDDRARTVLCGPEATRAGVRARCAAEEQRPSSVLAVPAGYVVVRSTPGGAPATFFVLRDDPSLRGADLRAARPDVTASGAPGVRSGLTPGGARRWQALTRAVVRRGAVNAVPGVPSARQSQHVAIVLDGRLIAVPSVDYTRHPDGLDGTDGLPITGGLTAAAARALAAVLRFGPLPGSVSVSDRAAAPSQSGRSSH